MRSLFNTTLTGSNPTITTSDDINLNTMTSVGNVSVGGSLTVESNTANTLSQTFGFFRLDGNGIHTGTSSGDTIQFGVSAPASAFLGGQFITVSDERLKTNVTTLDPCASLAALSKMRPCEYRYIDPFAFDPLTHTGFIAQQLQDVIPNATRRSTGRYLPNVYQMGRVVNHSIIEFPDPIDVPCDVKIQIQTSGGVVTPTVRDVWANAIKIDAYIQDSNVFVYGTWGGSIMTIDYDAIVSVAVSAIQGLARKVEELEQKLQEVNHQ